MPKTITTTLDNANDVLDYASKSNFPSTGDGGKIYIDKSTNTIYRWDGSSYVVVGSGNTGTVTSISVKMNDAIKGTITTSGTINLGTVITAHQDISGKQDTLVSGTNIKTINGTSLLGSGNISSVGSISQDSSDGHKLIVTSNGTPSTIIIPDNDTHYTTKLVVTNSTGTANASTTNGNTKLRLFDNNTARNTIGITGTGATTVSSDASGNITINSTNTITSVDSALSTTSTNPVQNKVINSALDNKQDTLVSGTNIKTINGNSILGSGDLTISGDSGSTVTVDAVSQDNLSFLRFTIS